MNAPSVKRRGSCEPASHAWLVRRPGTGRRAAATIRKHARRCSLGQGGFLGFHDRDRGGRGGGACRVHWLGTLVVLALAGNVRQCVVTGSTGGIYAETFALWMTVFLMFGFAPLFIRVEGAELLVTGPSRRWPADRAGVAGLSRGIPWRQVRQDIGLFQDASRHSSRYLARGYASPCLCWRSAWCDHLPDHDSGSVRAVWGGAVVQAMSSARGGVSQKRSFSSP